MLVVRITATTHAPCTPQSAARLPWGRVAGRSHLATRCAACAAPTRAAIAASRGSSTVRPSRTARPSSRLPFPREAADLAPKIQPRSRYVTDGAHREVVPASSSHRTTDTRTVAQPAHARTIPEGCSPSFSQARLAPASRRFSKRFTTRCMTMMCGTQPSRSKQSAGPILG